MGLLPGLQRTWVKTTRINAPWSEDCPASCSYEQDPGRKYPAGRLQLEPDAGFRRFFGERFFLVRFLIG